MWKGAHLEGDKRGTTRIMKKFKNYLEYEVFAETFPINNMTILITLSTWKWVDDFTKAEPETKKIMIEEMKKRRLDAMNLGYLYNSREIGVPTE